MAVNKRRLNRFRIGNNPIRQNKRTPLHDAKI